MAEKTYTSIERPYDEQLLRTDNSVETNDVAGVKETQGGREIQSGQDLNNAWIDTWIKSRNYLPKKQGFFLDAKNGLIEGEWVQVGTGIEMYGNDAYFYDYSTGGKGINSVTVSSGGLGYTVGNILTIVKAGAADGKVQVVAAPGGVVTAVAVTSAGAGYTAAAGLPTTGGSGTGCTITVNTLTATGDISGDTTTWHFIRKFYQDVLGVGGRQDFVFQKRIGVNSTSDSTADNVFEMYYPNAPQTGMRNYIFIGRAGNTNLFSNEHTDVIMLYSNQGFQYGTGAKYSLPNIEMNIVTSTFPGVTDMNPDGSRINLFFKNTNPSESFDPASLVTHVPFRGGCIELGVIDPAFDNNQATAMFIDISNNWMGSSVLPLTDQALDLGTLDWPAGSGTKYRWNNIYGTTYYGSSYYTDYGVIDGLGGYFRISSGAGTPIVYRNILVEMGGTQTMFINGAAIAPLTSGVGSSGLVSNFWSNVYTNNVTLSGSYINYESAKIALHSDTQIHGSLYATGKLQCDNAVITVGGTNFYPTSIHYMDGMVPKVRTFLVA